MKVDNVLAEAATEAYRLTGKRPQNCPLSLQLRRAAVSAALNTTEALQFTGAKEHNQLKIAYGSVREAKVATQILAEAQLVDLESGRALWRQLDEGARMLFGLLRKG